ncbi:MAG: hypothetical protein JRF33_25705 [Deltaproteobacteria bacterium]|nr:hypothetical protein [Deltaproteobacteria bacterium]
MVGVGRLLDLDRAPLVFGVENTQQVLQLLKRAGIPHAQELSAGKLSNIRFEHVWVAAYLPFTDYRGSAMEEGGELWTSMNTSLKAAGYSLNEPPPLPEDLDLTSISENYLQADRPETPLEFLKAEIEVLLNATQSAHSYEDLLQTREQKPQHQDILPSGLPFLTALVTSESTSLPERLLHQVKFTTYDAVNPSQVFFELTLPAYKLSNRSIALRYEPETVEDQEIINSFGGLGATPAYLVRLRPVLTVDGQRLAIGTAGLPMGADARLSIELAGPAGTKRFVNELVVGNLTVMALVAGKPVLANPVALEQKGAERIYFDEALMYLLRWQAAERELASLLRLKLLHPAPQVVTLGGVVQVNQVLGVPHEFNWKGASVDADLRQVELIGDNAAKKLFMDLSGLQGSVLEDRVLREDLGVDAISTARLLAIANNQGIPLLTINTSNVDTLLPSLPFGTKVKQDIRDAVQQGQQVLVLDRMLTIGVWTGVGYMRSDPLTGEAGWMLSGTIAGAYTVIDLAAWPEGVGTILEMMVGPPNLDENSSRAIAKLLAWDKQTATVGQNVELKVKVVDVKGNSVKSATVRFVLLEGGGTLVGPTDVTTNANGVATAVLTLGTKTSDNPIYLNMPGQRYTVQAGLNVVDAYLRGHGNHLLSPFTAYGLPDESTAEFDSIPAMQGLVMSHAGCVNLMLHDQYNNPISNAEIHVQASVPFLDSQDPPWDTRPAWVIQADDPCNNSYPSFDDVPLACSQPASHQQVIVSALNGASFCAALSGAPSAHYNFHVVADMGVTSPSLLIDILSYYSSFCGLGGLCNLEEHTGPTCLAKIGGTTEFPIRQEFVVRDRADQGETAQFCEDQVTCPVLTTLNSFHVTRDIDNRQIQATMQEAPFFEAQAEILDDGLTLLHMQFPDQPGVYHYDWSSSASVSIPHLGGGCGGCYSENLECSVDVYDQASNLAPFHKLIACTAVQLEFQDLPYAFNLDDYGYTTSDNDISFLILPMEYEPELALVEIFTVEDGVEKQAFYLHAGTGQNWATIGRGTYFDTSKDYYARLILNPNLPTEISSESVALSLYAAKIDLQAHKVGTTVEPGNVVSEYDEDDPEKLIMYVNSNKDKDTGDRDFLDDVVASSDKDIVKLVLKKVKEDDIQDGRVEFTLRPQELFKVYDKDLLPVSAADLIDLSSAPSPNLDIKAGDVTLYFESLGPVFGAEARLSILDRNGNRIAKDDVLLTAVFHEKDYYLEADTSRAKAQTCGGVPCNTIWGFPSGLDQGVYVSCSLIKDEEDEEPNPFWDEYVSVHPVTGRKYKSIRVKDGVDSSTAIADLFKFEEKKRYALECNSAIRAIQYRSVLNLLEACNKQDSYRCDFQYSSGTQAFNAFFNNILHLPVTSPEEEKYPQLRTKNVYKDDFSTGSWRYLENPVYKLEDTGWSWTGENLLQVTDENCASCLIAYFWKAKFYCPFFESLYPKLAQEQYFGHPSGTKTFKEWVKLFDSKNEDHLNDENKPDPVYPTYPIGISTYETEYDFLSLTKLMFKYSRGE